MTMERDSLVARLEDALRPFAAFAEQIARERPGWDHDGFTFGGPLADTKLTMGDFRRARAVYGEAAAALSRPEQVAGACPIPDEDIRGEDGDQSGSHAGYRHKDNRRAALSQEPSPATSEERAASKEGA